MTTRIETFFGEYIPGRRIEIHTDDPEKWGKFRRYHLVQYEVPSPHPVSWRSKLVVGLDAARKIGQLIRLDEEGDPEVPRTLGNLTSLAFDHHHGRQHDGALGDCGECYLRTADLVRAAAEELAVWDEWRAER